MAVLVSGRRAAPVLTEAAAVVAAVERLHFPAAVRNPRGERLTLPDGSPWITCDHCSTGDPYCTVSDEWPCPTIAAVLAARAS